MERKTIINHFNVATPTEWTLGVSAGEGECKRKSRLAQERRAQGECQLQRRLVPCLWEERPGTPLLLSACEL